MRLLLSLHKNNLTGIIHLISAAEFETKKEAASCEAASQKSLNRSLMCYHKLLPQGGAIVYHFGDKCPIGECMYIQVKQVVTFQSKQG